MSYSGGKDSDVILALTKMSGIPYEAIYKCTTIDPPGTIKHCLENGVTVMHAKKSMLDLIRDHGLPNAFRRLCCAHLKEYKVLDVAIQGVRRSESAARKNRYNPDEPVICRFYGSKKVHANVILPILNWTNDDVKEFIEHYGIKCHPLYYDENGNFNVKKRLGCMTCPMRSNNGIDGFEKYPKLLRQYLKATNYFWNKPRAKEIKIKARFKDIYHYMYANLFYGRRMREYEQIKDTIDAKKELEDHFKINLDIT